MLRPMPCADAPFQSLDAQNSNAFATNAIAAMVGMSNFAKANAPSDALDVEDASRQVTGNKPPTGPAWPGDLPDERRQSSSSNPIFQGDLNIALAAEAKMHLPNCVGFTID